MNVAPFFVIAILYMVAGSYLMSVYTGHEILPCVMFVASIGYVATGMIYGMYSLDVAMSKATSESILRRRMPRV